MILIKLQILIFLGYQCTSALPLGTAECPSWIGDCEGLLKHHPKCVLPEAAVDDLPSWMSKHCPPVPYVKSDTYRRLLDSSNCDNVGCEIIRANGFMAIYHDRYDRLCITGDFIPNCVEIPLPLKESSYKDSLNSGLYRYHNSGLVPVELIGYCKITIDTRSLAVLLASLSTGNLGYLVTVNSKLQSTGVLSPGRTEKVMLDLRTNTGNIAVRCGAVTEQENYAMTDTEYCMRGAINADIDEIHAIIKCKFWPHLRFDILAGMGVLFLALSVYVLPKPTVFVLDTLLVLPLVTIIQNCTVCFPLCTECGWRQFPCKKHHHYSPLCQLIKSRGHCKVCANCRVSHIKYAKSIRVSQTVVKVMLFILLADLGLKAISVSGAAASPIDTSCIIQPGEVCHCKPGCVYSRCQPSTNPLYMVYYVSLSIAVALCVFQSRIISRIWVLCTEEQSELERRTRGTITLLVTLLLLAGLPAVKTETLHDVVKDVFKLHSEHLTRDGFVVTSVDFTGCSDMSTTLSVEQGQNIAHWSNIALRSGSCISFTVPKVAGEQIAPEISVLFRELSWRYSLTFQYRTAKVAEVQAATGCACAHNDYKTCYEHLERRSDGMLKKGSYATYNDSWFGTPYGCVMGEKPICLACKSVPDKASYYDIYKATNPKAQFELCFRINTIIQCKLIQEGVSLKTAVADVYYNSPHIQDTIMVAEDYLGSLYTGPISETRTDEGKFGQPQWKKNWDLLHFNPAYPFIYDMENLWSWPDFRSRECFSETWHLRPTLQPIIARHTQNSLSVIVDSLGTANINFKLPKTYRKLINSIFNGTFDISDCTGCYNCPIGAVCKARIISRYTGFVKITCRGSYQGIINTPPGETIFSVRFQSVEKRGDAVCKLMNLAGTEIMSATAPFNLTQDERKLLLKIHAPLTYIEGYEECGVLCQLKSVVSQTGPFAGLIAVLSVIVALMGLFIFLKLINTCLRTIKSAKSLFNEYDSELPLSVVRSGGTKND